MTNELSGFSNVRSIQDCHFVILTEMRDGPEEVLWLYEVGEGAYRDVASWHEGREPD